MLEFLCSFSCGFRSGMSYHPRTLTSVAICTQWLIPFLFLFLGQWVGDVCVSHWDAVDVAAAVSICAHLCANNGNRRQSCHWDALIGYSFHVGFWVDKELSSMRVAVFPQAASPTLLFSHLQCYMCRCGGPFVDFKVSFFSEGVSSRFISSYRLILSFPRRMAVVSVPIRTRNGFQSQQRCWQWSGCNLQRRSCTVRIPRRVLRYVFGFHLWAVIWLVW